MQAASEDSIHGEKAAALIIAQYERLYASNFKQHTFAKIIAANTTNVCKYIPCNDFIDLVVQSGCDGSYFSSRLV